MVLEVGLSRLRRLRGALSFAPPLQMLPRAQCLGAWCVSVECYLGTWGAKQLALQLSFHLRRTMQEYLIKGSFVEKLRVTESEHSLVLEIIQSSWHVAVEILKCSQHVPKRSASLVSTCLKRSFSPVCTCLKRSLEFEGSLARKLRFHVSWMRFEC